VSDWRRPRSFLDRTIVGNGPIDMTAFLAAVDATGFEGSYSLEIFSKTCRIRCTNKTVVRGANWLQRLPQFERFVRFGPFASAIVISTIGAAMVGQGFAEQIGASRIAVTLLAALAIAGYAFAHAATHHRRIEAA